MAVISDVAVSEVSCPEIDNTLTNEIQTIDSKADIVWQYWSSEKKCFQEMDAEYASKYEKARQEGRYTLEYTVAYGCKKQHIYEHKVCFQTYTQTNTTTGTKRKLRRLIVDNM